MQTRVRSYSKINLGLAIGPPRPDGFHALSTLYQTIALHDVVSVQARPSARSRILLQSNDSRVPTDGRNTAIRMVEKALDRMGITAEVALHIQKNLPIQGGMGAGSANAAAALIGLEKELEREAPGKLLPPADRLAIAAEVGSDVPLFLIGGAVLGSNRGEAVTPVTDITYAGSTEIHAVMAIPKVGVSTPQAFRDWDQSFAVPSSLHNPQTSSTLEKLSRTYASILQQDLDFAAVKDAESGASGIFRTFGHPLEVGSPGKQQGISREQLHTQGEAQIDLAENSLLALVRTGIENDFETVVFLQHPPLREIKRQLMGSDSGQPAILAGLSGSGSALFGLYRSQGDAEAAQQRVQHDGVPAIVTKTLPRPLYWRNMFAE
ncbi:4-(cytidine 5'-diphospho)-2-C-methyl-D-erythritol kinase [Granulicella sp. WH15]|uniref:4-(cytidine 5'-diphospho)-2-C-methyl-D-erythritol kinase n=1 Tax=Granulicella sp. WH15 TaxID=2602070 RepID=UPI0013677002|nr:4-(cytidine 5'-diphospho)-2-C-methyl-D-erythritol kinase [Granulicella sp. WH15]QHN02672.1 4-(cytidine 5'-diphospho)-2-C-methyl-D-erythritol kinase [Granulicella sp. WH15]